MSLHVILMRYNDRHEGNKPFKEGAGNLDKSQGTGETFACRNATMEFDLVYHECLLTFAETSNSDCKLQLQSLLDYLKFPV